MRRSLALFASLALVTIGMLSSCDNQATNPEDDGSGSSGTFTDSRDGRTYKWEKIGTQVWMAQNLDYMPSSGNSWCYNGSTANCTTYGRLYDWATAMGISTKYDSTTYTSIWSGSNVNHQGICPSGWHVPSDAEWTKLTDTTLISSTAGTKLKANSSLWSTNTGTNDFGFTILPAGYVEGGSSYVSGSFFDIGSYAFFWSTSEDVASSAWIREFDRSYAGVHRYSDSKSRGFSLRCLKD
jgi:uncharacterized protein (TIGR02145 family)